MPGLPPHKTCQATQVLGGEKVESVLQLPLDATYLTKSKLLLMSNRRSTVILTGKEVFLAVKDRVCFNFPEPTSTCVWAIFIVRT